MFGVMLPADTPPFVSRFLALGHCNDGFWDEEAMEARARVRVLSGSVGMTMLCEEGGEGRAARKRAPPVRMARRLLGRSSFVVAEWEGHMQTNPLGNPLLCP
jgi:hypothetical protein